MARSMGSQISAGGAGSTGSSGAGAGGSGLPAAESGNDALHKTIITLNATPLTFADDPGLGAYSTYKLYDFPSGNIIILGAVIDADITLNEGSWVNTIAGDVALGSAAVANGDALATTEQNIIPTTEIAPLVAQDGPINAQSTAQYISGLAGGADLDLNLNIRIDDDAAHFANLVGNGTFGSDTVWVKGVGWTIAGGVGVSDGSQVAVSSIYQPPGSATAMFAGLRYSLSFGLVRTTGTITPVVGSTSGTTRSTTNTFVETITATDAVILVGFIASDDFTGTIDNVTLIPVDESGSVTGTVTVVWTNTGDF